MQELLSNLAEALRPIEAADFRQAAPEVQEPASVAATQKDAAEQPSAAAEDAAQAAKPGEEAGNISAVEEGPNSEQPQRKPQADMRSAPSAAEKLEQEINATAEQVGHVYTVLLTCNGCWASWHSQLVADKRSVLCRTRRNRRPKTLLIRPLMMES